MFDYFILFHMCEYFGYVYLCVQFVYLVSLEDIGTPGIEVRDHCGQSYGCWE